MLTFYLSTCHGDTDVCIIAKYNLFQIQHAGGVTCNYKMIVLLHCEFNAAYFPCNAQCAYHIENITYSSNKIMHCQIFHCASS